MPLRTHPLPNPPRGLFDPPPSTPTWDLLPESVRREAVEILARMISNLRPTPDRADTVQEVADE